MKDNYDIYPREGMISIREIANDHSKSLSNLVIVKHIHSK